MHACIDNFIFCRDDGEPFFVFNSDVICEYRLQEFLDFHNSHEGEGTILVILLLETIEIEEEWNEKM